MKLIMRNGNTAIKITSPNEKTPSGIYMPQTAKQGALRIGKVFCAGPGELIQGQFIENDLKENQDVIFDTSRSEVIDVDGETVYICNMIDVIAKIEGKHLASVPPLK